MALAMPRPTPLASGVYRLNVRVPADLAPKMRGRRVTLPFDDSVVTVVATDKVAFSLRTKDPALARARFTPAYAALAKHFDDVRAGPRPVTHKQAVALAGEVYRRHVERHENDPALTPEAAGAALREMDEDVASWRFGSGEQGDDHAISYESAKVLAAIARPSGAAMLSWETQADVDTGYAKITLDEALEDLFGRDADALVSEKCLYLDPASRRLLLSEIGKAIHDSANKLARNLGGDYAPDPTAARFPPFVSEPQPPQPKPRRTAGKETVGALFARWCVYFADKRSAATVRRYGPSLASLDAWAKDRDWRSLTDADVFAWATHRHEKDGVAAATVNKNDLVAVSSVLAWPTTLAGGKLATTNAAKGVKLDPPRKRGKREKMFRAGEISAILRLARSVVPVGCYPRASASRRWCPWLCAYTGARVQETLWLRKRDVWQEDGVWLLDFKETKDGHARRVPIHGALIEEGFLDFVAAAPSDYLFVGDRPSKESATRSTQEMRASELASWVQAKVKLEAGVSPNHAWRHTWITLAERAGIPKRLSNRITGHNAGEDASDKYVNGILSVLAEEMGKFPRYKI